MFPLPRVGCLAVYALRIADREVYREEIPVTSDPVFSCLEAFSRYRDGIHTERDNRQDLSTCKYQRNKFQPAGIRYLSCRKRDQRDQESYTITGESILCDQIRGRSEERRVGKECRSRWW